MKKVFAWKAVALCFCALLLTACGNPLGSNPSFPEKRTVTFRGTISLSGAVPAEFSSPAQNLTRSALPSVNTTDYYYFVEASSDTGETFTLGKNNADEFSVSDGLLCFDLSLSLGNWEITVGIKSMLGDGICMSDYFPKTISEDDVVITHAFVLKPVQEGDGKIILDMTVPVSGDYAVGKITAVCDNDDWEEAVPETNIPVLDTTVTLTVESIPSGVYEVTFCFYRIVGTKEILLYTTTQSVNVIDNMTTKTWKAGNTNGPITSSGTFELNSTHIQNQQRTIFYVGNTSVGNASDTTGTGSAYSPFASISKACSYIVQNNKADEEYTIFVCGTVTGPQNILSSLNSKASSITLQGYNGLDEHGVPKDSLNGNNSGTTLKIETSVSVTVKNLLITGGGNTTKGGGINVASGATVTLESGAVVSGNSSSEDGGGIYSQGILTLKSGSCVGDKTKSTHATNSNRSNSSARGGGIAFTSGTLTIESGAKVVYNFAYQGGGIHFNGSTYDTNNVLTLCGGEVAYNGCDPRQIGRGECSWSSYGGGLFLCGCRFVFSSGTIHDNYGSDGAGGLFLQLCDSAVMSGGSIYNNSMHANGYQDATEILLFGACTLSMTNGSVYNSSTVERGVRLRETTSILEMSGPAAISSSAPVILASGTKIKVTDRLTGTAPVATITSEDPSRGCVIVEADGTKVSDLTSYKTYFTFTNSDWNVKLSADKKKFVLDAPIYVKANGTATATGTSTDPFDTIKNACFLLTSNSGEYTIYIDGTLSAVQEIPETITAASLTVQGTSAAAKIDAGEAGPALTINAKNIPITILNLTVTKGKTSYHGGGIHIQYSQTKVTLGDGTSANGVFISTNKGNQGGGIYNAGELTITEGVMISGNTATLTGDIADGGGIYNTGTVTMNGGQICSNTAGSSSNTGKGIGGGVVNTGTFYFRGGKIYGNTAFNNGGGVYNDGGTFCMCSSAVVGDATKRETAKSTTGNYSNFAYNNGGGIYSTGTGKVYVGYYTELSMTGCAGGVCYNFANYDGGGICGTADSEISLYQAPVLYNKCANGNGGGINSQKTLYILECTIEGNAAAYGGGIYNTGSCTTYRNTSYTDESYISIKNNTATSGKGGGIYNTAGVTFNAGLISGNTATGSGASGAGVFTGGSDSVFSMAHGEITGNTLVNNNTSQATYSSGGGGVAVGTFSVGAGSPAAGTFQMTGGKIHGNTVEKTENANAEQDVAGSGVYVMNNDSALFKIGADAYIYDNDVFLCDGRKIKIVSNLSKHTSSDQLTVTPERYADTVTVLEADSGVTLGDQVGKFTLTPSTDGKLWYIASGGNLKKYYGTKLAPDAVGDIVFNDGSATPYSSDLTLTDDQKNAAIAVIFYIGTECSNNGESRMLGVGLLHSTSGLAWCLESATAYSRKVNTVCKIDGSDGAYTFSEDKDGSDNFEQLSTSNYVTDSGTQAKYPAWYFAKNYASQSGSNINGTDYENEWYFPSIAELFYIWKVKSTVDNASTLCNGSTFGDKYYWSSSQSNSTNSYMAYYFSFGNGVRFEQGKQVEYYICAIRAF